MLSFRAGSHRFHLRAAAVIMREGSVLLHRAEGDSFWALPGGRVEPGEEAAHAVVREMREELAVEVAPSRLAWVVENFFTYQGEAQHEIGLYFLAEPAEGGFLLNRPGPYAGIEGAKQLEFAWFKVAQLGSLELRPTFLVGLLAGQDFSFRHVVHYDE
jgi:ADP-ribose pyrophosphatase YjhB (NUDIX family)